MRRLPLPKVHEVVEVRLDASPKWVDAPVVSTNLRTGQVLVRVEGGYFWVDWSGK